MAVLTVAAFISKWGTTNFPSTGNRSITAAKMREFKDDIADSFQSVLGAVTITSWKSPCVVATTANISLTGEQTIDGILTSTSRVLVKNQTSTLQNGIYVSAAGAWSRATDADSAGELEGAAVSVTQGTINQNTVWSQTTDSITLETSAIAWQQVGYATATNVLDEDDFASNSATEPPSQQSTKAYVDAQIADTLIHASATITATQITNSFTSPVTLATAPGGFIPILIGPVWAVKTYVGAVFATNTNSRVSVGGQQSASLTDMMTNGSDARQLVDVTTGVNVNAYSGGDSIVFRTLIGNPTGGGTSTVTIYFSYKLSPI
jgi:hypothetical protein